MEEILECTVQTPQWGQGRQLDEMGFCREFLLLYPLVRVDGQFFGPDGRLPEEKVRQMVYNYLSGFVAGNLSRKIGGLMEVLKMECWKESLPLYEGRIYCSNGTFHVLSGTLDPRKEVCRYRLPVAYDPQAPEPKLWKQFLEELLDEEDILTLQEYMGYCLVPVNYAQKMLLIIGKGGEGKSRIGIILNALLGDGMCNGSIAKLETSPFARADLQHRLVMVDDDLRLEALNSTNYIKSLVTAEQPMDLERKGVQSYQGEMHCRILGFGNGHLRSLHDRSYGFFRRQLILTTRDKPRDRVDDPYLAQRMKDELGGILLWCMEGLERLLTNGMQFTISKKTRHNMNCAILESNNVLDFMNSRGYFTMDPQAQASSRSLYSCYRDWCEDNMHTALPPKSFSVSLLQNASAYGLTYCNTIPGGNGRHVRGFKGIRILR